MEERWLISTLYVEFKMFNAGRQIILKSEFLRESKKVLKTNISKNQETLESYKFSIVHSFNNFINYVGNFYETFSPTSKQEADAEIVY